MRPGLLAGWREPWRLPEDPFYEPRRPLWQPAGMRFPPAWPSRVGAMERRFALLINPYYAKDPHASYGKHVLTPSLALTSVAAATPASWRVAIWDENLLQGPVPADPLPRVVGISVHLTFANRAYALADWFRARGSLVVLGGLHVLSCPEEAAPHADALVLGDGVTCWPKVLEDAASGSLSSRYSATFETDYDTDPLPRRDLLPRDSFLTTASLIATRGCHNRCGFCYLSTEGLRMPYRVRDPRDIRRQWAATDEPYAVFIDNNLGSRPDYLHALCAELRPLNRIWSAAVTLDVTDDPSLVRAMALAGCTGVFIGFESLTDDNLIESRKRTPRAEDYARRVGLLHENGIQVNGSFVLGFDHDRPEVFTRLAEWVETNRLECATFHLLTPYPGTPLFRKLEAEGRLLHRDWSRYDTAHVVFQPRHLTVEQLEQGYDWLYRRLFSLTSIWRRRPAGVSALGPYLAMSLLYKRSNRLWHALIRHRLVHRVWRPLVEVTRLRHLAFRRALVHRPLTGAQGRPSSAPLPGPVPIVPAGV